jgi:aminocarboxymuconate-semialdehyde decarboxylase
MLIDLHAHQITGAMFHQHPHWGPFWENGRLRVGDWTLGSKRHAPPMDELLATRWSVAKRLDDMRACDIDKFVVSMPLHLVMYHTEPKFAIRWARAVNDSLAEWCAADPERLHFWAHAPLQDPAAAAAELDRAVNDLGAKGLSMGGANFGGLQAHSRELYPMWEKVSELDVMVFVHGYNQSVTWKRPMDDPFDTTSVVGMNSDEALFYWYVTNGGVLDDFPDLKLLITHGGGFVPFQRRRFHATNKTMAPDSRNKKELAEYDANFFYDLDIHSPHMRQAIIAEVGVDQVVYGDNFGGADSHEGDLTEGMGLTGAEREQIRSGNALRLIKF